MDWLVVILIIVALLALHKTELDLIKKEKEDDS